MKNVKITVNGNLYEVEITDITASPIEVIVNGNKYNVEVEPASSPVISEVSHGPAISAPAPIKKGPSRLTPTTPSSDSKEIRAPMPGLILDVSVKAGDKVSYGQNLLALEAMKMKNAIRAPRDGVISCVSVTNDQKVAYNDLLITFE
jgi:biotin carboxyl carrier protein